MTRHRDQIAHIQRTGVNAGRKTTEDVYSPDVFCCDACGAWCAAEDGILVHRPCEGVVCPKCASPEPYS